MFKKIREQNLTKKIYEIMFTNVFKEILCKFAIIQAIYEEVWNYDIDGKPNQISSY